MSLEQVLAKLEEISSRLSKLEAGGHSHSHAPGPAAAAGAGHGGAEGAAVTAYQGLIDQHLSQFVALSEKIGGDTVALGPLVLACANELKALIAEASKSKKPSPAEFQNILKPLSEAIAAVTKFQSTSRSVKDKNNVYGVAEGIGIFGWVTVEPTPAPFALEMVGAAKFYTDKILREFKGKDETQTAWVHAWVGFLEGLPVYIKQYHTTGLAWNPKGEAAKVPSGGAAAPAPKAAPTAAAAPVKAGPALFSELNKGGAITSGLKKVARDQTNKDKKISGKVEEKGTKPVAAAPSKPAKCELNGTKWTVEYQVNTDAPVIVKATAKNQTVYIFKCDNAVIIIEGKVNSIALDSCKKSSVVFDECVATCEVMNCQSVKVQVKQKIPAIAVDKTAGIQIFLPETSLETEIVTATSSEMNICIPNPNIKGPEDDLLIELPVPEQFKSVIKNHKLQTDKVDHSGG